MNSWSVEGGSEAAGENFGIPGNLKKEKIGVSEMAEQVTKPDSLSSVPGTSMMEGES